MKKFKRKKQNKKAKRTVRMGCDFVCKANIYTYKHIFRFRSLFIDYHLIKKDKYEYIYYIAYMKIIIMYIKSICQLVANYFANYFAPEKFKIKLL